MHCQATAAIASIDFFLSLIFFSYNFKIYLITMLNNAYKKNKYN